MVREVSGQSGVGSGLPSRTCSQWARIESSGLISSEKRLASTLRRVAQVRLGKPDLLRPILTSPGSRRSSRCPSRRAG